MEFDIVTQFMGQLDEIMQTFLSDTVGKLISIGTPIVGMALVMSLMIQGLYTMLSTSGGEPLSELVKRFVRYAIIMSVVGAGGFYQTTLVSMAMDLPYEISSSIVLEGSDSDAENIGGVIDETMNKGLEIAGEAWDNVTWYPSGDSMAALVVTAHTILWTALVTGLGAAIILMSKMMLVLSLAFGPVFIFCLLFDNLKYLFSPWIGSVINFTLATVLISAVYSLLLTFYSNVLEQALNKDIPILFTMAADTIVGIVVVLVTLKIPDVASSWSSGVSASVQSRPLNGATGKVASAGASGGSSVASGGVNLGKRMLNRG